MKSLGKWCFEHTCCWSEMSNCNCNCKETQKKKKKKNYVDTNQTSFYVATAVRCNCYQMRYSHSQQSACQARFPFFFLYKKKKSFYFFGKQKFLFFIFYEVTLESLMYIMLQFNVTMFMVTSWHLSNEIWKVQSPNGRTLKLNSSSKIHICDIDKICIQLSLDEFYFSKKKFRRILPNWVRWHHIQLTCVIILNHLTH